MLTPAGNCPNGGVLARRHFATRNRLLPLEELLHTCEKEWSVTQPVEQAQGPF